MLSPVFYILVWSVFGGSLAALLWSLIGYPLLMGLVSRHAASPPVQRELPLVSLIIPAHNEADVIRAKLENSRTIDYPSDRIEVIVACDGCDDGTVELAREYEGAGVTVVDLQPRRGKASTLNDAVDMSTGEVLCLCDANVMFRPDAIRQMVIHFSDSSVGAVTGDVRLRSEESDFGEGENLYYRLERTIQLGESRIGSLVCVDGGMYVLRRELYEHLPSDTVLDDFTTTMNVIRRGSRVIYEPAAVADENGTPSWRQEYRRRVRTTKGAVQSIKRHFRPPLSRPVIFWQYVSHKLLRWLGPVWLIATFVSSCGLWHTGGMMRGLVVAQSVVYGSAVVVSVVYPLRDFKYSVILFYVAMSQLAMLDGLLRGIFGPAESGTWDRTPRTKSCDVAASAAGASRTAG